MGEVVLRFVYRGESLRNGRVLRLGQVAGATVSGEALLAALSSEDTNVDLRRWRPFVYSRELEGWEPLRPGTRLPLEPLDTTVSVLGSAHRRVEVTLEARVRDDGSPPPPPEDLAVGAAAAFLPWGEDGDAMRGQAFGSGADEDAGYFGIGVYNSKSADNVGTLWRSAFMLGASFVYTSATAALRMRRTGRPASTALLRSGAARRPALTRSAPAASQSAVATRGRRLRTRTRLGGQCRPTATRAGTPSRRSRRTTACGWRLRWAASR